MTTQTFVITNTLEEVCKAISSAETSLREHINTYYHNVNEEFITMALYGQINHALQNASKKELIEKAFIKDLEGAIKPRYWHQKLELTRLKSEAKGLVADIVLHNRSEEGGTKTKTATGGDFGLVILHPQIQVSYTHSETSIEITEKNSSGLLCQAKLKNKEGKWGKFSKKQEKVLPERMDFASLVLYSYADKNRTELNTIDWKLCKEKEFLEIKDSLKTDSLDELLTTSEVLMQLGSGTIGTQDNKIIEEIISPSVRQSLIIKIHWKNNFPADGKKISLYEKTFQQEKIQIHQNK